MKISAGNHLNGFLELEPKATIVRFGIKGGVLELQISGGSLSVRSLGDRIKILPTFSNEVFVEIESIG